MAYYLTTSPVVVQAAKRKPVYTVTAQVCWWIVNLTNFAWLTLYVGALVLTLVMIPRSSDQQHIDADYGGVASRMVSMHVVGIVLEVVFALVALAFFVGTLSKLWPVLLVEMIGFGLGAFLATIGLIVESNAQRQALADQLHLPVTLTLVGPALLAVPWLVITIATAPGLAIKGYRTYA